MSTKHPQHSKIITALATLALAVPATSQTIGGRIQVSAITDSNTVDTAYSAYQDCNLVVWAQLQLGIYRIRAQRVGSNGVLLGGVVNLASSPVQAWHPAVAYVAKAQRFVIVWQERAAGRWVIKGKTLDPSSGATSITTELVSSPHDNLEPDIGGDLNTSESKAILVWRREGSGILTSQVTVNPIGGPLRSPVTLQASASPADALPAISKSGGSAHRYMLAWKRNGAIDIVYARSLTKGGGARGATVTLGTGTEIGAPDVDGDGTYFVVAWARQRSILLTKRDAFARMVRFDGSTAVSHSPTETLALTSLDEGDPAVGFTGNKFAVAWSQEVLGGTKDIFMKMFAPTQMVACGPRSAFRGSRTQNVRPAIGSMFAGGSEKDEALVAYISEASGGVVDAQRIEGMGSGGPISDIGGGCGLGGLASAHGAFAVGNPDFEVRLSGIPLGLKLVVLNIAPKGPPLLSCGLCQISTPTVLISRKTATGQTGVKLPIPCDNSLIGDEFQLQFYVLDSGTTACSALMDFSFSNRLEGKLAW